MALLAAYNFDEASGGLLDVTGNGHDVPLSGDLFREPGHTNTGLGKNGGVDMTPTTPFGQTALRTIMAWCLRVSTNQNTWIIGYIPSSTGSGTWGLIYLSGQLQIRSKDASGTVQVAEIAEPVQGSWHHAAGTYDGANLRLYVDGSLVATTPQNALYDLNDEFYFLLTASVGTTIDDVRIYDEALDQATISTLMNTPVASGPAPVEELSGTLALTLDTAGALTVPPASIAGLQGSLPLTLSTAGTLEMPPATIDSLSGSLELTLTLDGALADPNETGGAYSAEVDHVTYSATALVPEHTAEVEA